MRIFNAHPAMQHSAVSHEPFFCEIAKLQDTNISSSAAVVTFNMAK
jgi:hypothetical protein